MNENDKLLPCPFCGSSATLLETVEGYYKIGCDNDLCFAYLDIEVPNWIAYTSEDAAIKAWNQRQP